MEQEEFTLDNNLIVSELERITQLAKTQYNTIEYRQLALSLIDLTTLNSTDTEEGVVKFTEKVNQFPEHFPELTNVAAICIYPNMVEAVERTLQLPEVNIAAVAGGFPSSMTFTEVKAMEAQMAVEKGADEIDIVLALSEFLPGNFEAAHNDIAMIRAAIEEAHLKVILETGALKTNEDIWRASLLAINAGADFIKTSTGKIEPAATPLAAYIMCSAIAYHFEETGEKIGFKPAGGIVSSEDALVYVAIVSELLGEEWLTPELFRIGASRLANNLLSDITGKQVSFF